MERLIEVLKLIASPSGEQKAAFPSFVSTADEIALLFGEELRLAEANGMMSDLDFETRRQLRLIDDALDKMSDTPDLWSNEALANSPEWQGIREYGRAILSRLGREVEKPNLRWLNYVKS